MKIFTTSQIKDLDKYTIEKEAVSSIDLMERASSVFVDEFKMHFNQDKNIIVFAGPGNNGGDALAISRFLLIAGYQLEVFLFNVKDNLSPDCQINKERLERMGHVKFLEIKGAFTPPVLPEGSIVIDGLFGSGLNQTLSGGFSSLVKYINKSKARVVSIDIPSGLFGEDNTFNDKESVIKADFTFTFQFPKIAFFLSDNQQFLGEWKVLDIHLNQEIIESTPVSYYLLEKENISAILRPRKRFAHKGDFGHALLLAGSRGKMGAAVLASGACLRTGVGLLTVHAPKCGTNILQITVPEAMVSEDENDCFITSVINLRRCNFIGAGPGMGTENDTALMLDVLFREFSKPMVLDADALNILAEHKEMLHNIPVGSILTPHPKEFDRLVGDSGSDYERLQKALNFATQRECYIVLKGAYTAICTPEKECYFNSTGNPGMATAGSGDVLTGMILSLLNQSYSPKESAILGVYLHGLAGDMAAKEKSQPGMIAGDIIDKIGEAFNTFSSSIPLYLPK